MGSASTGVQLHSAYSRLSSTANTDVLWEAVDITACLQKVTDSIKRSELLRSGRPVTSKMPKLAKLAFARPAIVILYVNFALHWILNGNILL